MLRSNFLVWFWQIPSRRWRGLKRDKDDVIKLDKFLKAYAEGEDLGSLEFKVIKNVLREA